MKNEFVHDDVRDQFASVLKDVCHDVQAEPHLQTLTGEALNNSANSSSGCQCARFLAKGANAFFDVKIFNPFVKSHLNQELDTVFTSNENEKKRHYNQSVIEVEHGFFSHLVFSQIWRKQQRSQAISSRTSTEAIREKTACV